MRALNAGAEPVGSDEGTTARLFGVGLFDPAGKGGSLLRSLTKAVGCAATTKQSVAGRRRPRPRR
jgi:hypothetical protein